MLLWEVDGGELIRGEVGEARLQQPRDAFVHQALTGPRPQRYNLRATARSYK